MQVIYDARAESGWKHAVGIIVIALAPFLIGFLILSCLAWRDGLTIGAAAFLVMGVGTGYTASIVCRSISLFAGHLEFECSFRTIRIRMASLEGVSYGVAPSGNWGYMAVHSRGDLFPVVVICVGNQTLEHRLAEMAKEIESLVIALDK